MIDGEDSDGIPSGVTSFVNPDAVGNAGGVTIFTGNLSLTNGGRVSASTFGQGNAGSVNIAASDTITIDGEGSRGISGITSRVNSGAEGDAGGVTIDTGSLNLTNRGRVDASASGQGNAGRLTVQANSVSLDDASIRASTRSGTGGIITLRIDNELTLDNNSLISAEAFNNANGGNIDIDAEFIITYLSSGNGNDIIASAGEGRGGNINIAAESVFNLQEGEAIDGNGTNDIDVSGNLDDGQVNIITPTVDIIQGLVEAPENVVEPEQTVAQACQSDRIAGKVSGLEIKGKGGIPPLPTEPMDADAILVNGKIATTNPQAQSLDIKPIQTSQGDIYPARGIIVTESGEVILTAYPTDGIDTRTPQISPNCS